MDGKPVDPLLCPVDGSRVQKFDPEYTDAVFYRAGPGVTVTDGPELAAWSLKPCGCRLRACDWELCFSTAGETIRRAFVPKAAVDEWLKAATSQEGDTSDRDE
jgi:hypothetical protein